MLASILSMEVTAMRKPIIAFVAAVALTGCGSNGSTSAPPATKTPVDVGTPAPDRAPSDWTASLAQTPYAPKVDPAQFTDTITNRYFPLVPGTVMVYEGKRDGRPLRIELTVTNETKDIMGVRTVVVRDIVSGALDERTSDWYSQDTAGNVWYFGEDTKEYKNGVVSSTAGTWMAGVDAALPGIIMQARPVQGQAYRQEYRPTQAEDVAMIKQLRVAAEVPAGKYSDVLVTNDRDLLDLKKDEDKYFAPGVGLVKLGGFVNGHREDVWLVSILAAK
jgi:predicted small lipoprotein YifL